MTDHLTAEERTWARWAEAASPGPWRETSGEEIVDATGRLVKADGRDHIGNMEHIRSARTAVPALAAQLSTARALLLEWHRSDTLTDAEREDLTLRAAEYLHECGQLGEDYE